MATTPHPNDHPPAALTETSYDVVVLGAGSTGENVAGRLVRGGLSAVVVETELVGGDCSYWACMPSKAMLRSPEVLAAARRLEGASQAVTGEVDAAAVLARRDRFVSGYDDGSQVAWLDSEGVPLVRGTGRLSGERTVAVTGPDGSGVTLTARHAVVVCTGSTPSLPPVEGLADAKPWTSRDATSAKQAPPRLAILGGGVVGCEMATAWSALGSEQVTVLERSDRVLANYEPEAGRRLTEALRKRGVDVRTGVRVTAVRRPGGSGPITVELDGGASVDADEILVAAGRAARTQDLGLDTVGLRPGDWLSTDDTLTVQGVDGSWLYAAGDVNHRALLTHMGKYQARICGDVIVARAKGERVEPAPWSHLAATADHDAVPQVTFTDPQVASVGRTEQQARDAGIPVRTVEYEIGSVAGAALLADGYSGWAKLVVDSDREVIVGATFLGQDVAELVHSATVAVVGEVPLSRLWHAVPSYPTISEVWLRLLEAYGC